MHLCDFPEVGARDVELEVAMGVVRETVRLGLAARGQAKLGVRQPLREAVVVAAGAEREAIERLEDIVAASSTSRSCASSRRPTSSAPTRSSPTTARSARASASTCRRWRPRSPRSIPRTSPTRCATARRVGISVDGHDHELGADDLLLAMQPARGLPARARGLARRGARARARRRAGPRGPGARGRPRGAERAQDGRARGRRPDRAHARRRRRAARRRARVRGLRGRRDAGRRRRLRRRDGGEQATVKGRPLQIAVERA